MPRIEYISKLRKAILKMLSLLAAVILLWLFAIGAVWVVCLWVSRTEPRQDTDAIIVLGAQVLPNGQPNRILKTRLDMTIEAYAARQRPIICCGAQGEDEPEAEGKVMRDYLIAHGIPKEQIKAETSSYNTYENLENAKKLLDPNIKSVLIITSDYHVARSLWIARDKGLDAAGAGSPTFWLWRFKNHTKEALSWIKYCYMKISGKV